MGFRVRRWVSSQFVFFSLWDFDGEGRRGERKRVGFTGRFYVLDLVTGM